MHAYLLSKLGDKVARIKNPDKSSSGNKQSFDYWGAAWNFKNNQKHKTLSLKVDLRILKAELRS